ncbi:hypothetical protein [Elioraea sp.]|uniref:hypothetical protein n=1 Tax=Elioraea sp. TaxID=2185103 RepID=UPI0021DD072C|nr:hypothetical protein [Elioraea sp.]GIX08451.1 MAG: hypothetical protein KatS3mg116_0161 [Elioraea sp.]
MTLSAAAPAIAAAFLASMVEVVEAFTIVLAVATLRGWRPAASGTAAALAVLAALVAGFGPLLAGMPIAPVQLAVGILLLLFGLGWLRKAALRAAGVLPLRDEDAVYARARAALGASAAPSRATGDWIAGLAAFKAVLLEGLEVVFVVLAVGAGHGLVVPAALGALAACGLVLGLGAMLHRPLARVPENGLKFGVGTMLAAFGVFWTGEGLGVGWPGQEGALVVLALLFLAAGLCAIAAARQAAREAVR